MDVELALALELANLADAVTLPRFRAADLVVESKPDLTPVSEADRAVELAIRERVARVRPGHVVVGEEFGDPGGEAPRWIVDPIDGTKNYVRGIPVWASLIALEEDGEVRCGVVSAPALGRRWWAARGEGAWAADRRGDGWAEASRLQVSAVSRLEDAQLFHTSFNRMSPRELTGFLALAEGAARIRGFGDFWSHVLVAEGAGEIGHEPAGVSVWDLAPLIVILEEAGGRFTDHRGRRTVRGGDAISSNGLLHEAALAALAGEAAPA
jgi:histidinol-phosphatase